MSAALSPDVAEQLLRHVSGARWFGGKGRRAAVVGVTPLPWLTDPAADLDAAGPAVRLEVVEVAYLDAPVDDGTGPDPAPADDGAPEVTTPDGPLDGAPRDLYQLAVAYRPAPHAELQGAEIGRWTDADLGPVVAYDATQDPAAASVLLRALLDERRVGADDAEVRFHLSAAEGLTAELEPSVFRGQQSNTSVMFGEVAMLKLFRRLELGRNLDIEVHDALSRTGTSDVARLFGWAEATWSTTDASGAPATLTADLAMVVEKLAQATDGWDLALHALQAGADFTAEARALGRALAETHAALRAAFPTDRRPGDGVAAVMADRLAAARAVAPALEDHRTGLEAVFGALAGHDLDVQRVHGDFHLGQTLHTPDGWKIIDFEGEPAKTMAERVAPDSVWRDIAGMLRSFGYAEASVPGPGSAAWASACRDAFLDGYAGGPLDPADAGTLRAYEADKAVYEVVYEVRNRPEWVQIPLGALAALTGATPHDPTSTDAATSAADPDQGARRPVDTKE
ncbi:maltokinase N-terminal cap-like domain-containing protein [Microlunatus capsulatus]|uniref:maltokinase N-terminal cap-like domain-containing protein n=1 Tax=Microlunatus capsulatus TaxID=99117 RepID=UPI0031DACC91